MRRILGLAAAAVMLTGCATGAPVAEMGVPATSSDGPTSPSTVTTPTVSTSATDSSAACDLAASGAAGVPTEDSRPLITIRLYSYWFQTDTFGPRAVVYDDGSVAITQSSETVSKRPTDPLRPYLGGRFAACAVDDLVAEFGELAAVDLGDPWIYDATEAQIEVIGRAVPGIPTSLHVKGFGYSDFADLTAEQNAARRGIAEWVDRITGLIDGAVLPMDRLAVVGTIGSSGPPRSAVAWRAPVPQGPGCVALTGSAVDAALASVRLSFRQLKSYPHWSTRFTGTFQVGKENRQLTVMALPPGMSC